MFVDLYVSLQESFALGDCELWNISDTRTQTELFRCLKDLRIHDFLPILILLFAFIPGLVYAY